MDTDFEGLNRRELRRQRVEAVLRWPVRVCRYVAGEVLALAASLLVLWPSFLVLGAMVLAGLLVAVVLLPVVVVVVALWNWMMEINQSGTRMVDRFEQWGRRGA